MQTRVLHHSGERGQALILIIFAALGLIGLTALAVDGTGDAGINGQIIGYTVNISGTSLMRIYYNAGVNYFGPISPRIELTQ